MDSAHLGPRKNSWTGMHTGSTIAPPVAEVEQFAKNGICPDALKSHVIESGGLREDFSDSCQ